MPRITPYQQGQLASGLVGTPNEGLTRQAELSGAHLSEQIGSDLTSLGQQQYAQYQQQKLQKQREVDAYNKHLADLSRSTTATTIATNAEADSRKDMNQIQMQYRDNPIAGVDAYNQLSQSRIVASVDQVSKQYPQDPELAMEVQKQLQENHKSRMNTLGTWADGLQVPNMERQLKEGSGALSQQLSQMGGNNLDQAKAAIDAYVAKTKDIYHQVSPGGVQDLYDVSGKAMDEYVKSVALRGDPKALQETIDQLSDGHYIAPDKLLAAQATYKAMAANQASINNQIVAAGQQQSLLQTVQQLIGAGNGNIRQNDPGVNQQIIQKAAPNLKPEHLLELTKMAGEGAGETANAQARGNVQSAIDLAGGPKASPQAIQAALDKYGKGLSPEEKASFQIQGAKAQAGQSSLSVDQIIAGNMAGQIKGMQKLHTMIMQQQMSVMSTTGDPQMHAKHLQDLQNLTMRYAQNAASLKAMQKSIKDPAVRSLVDMEGAKNTHDYNVLIDSMAGMGNSDPKALQAVHAHRDLYDNFYSRVAPQQRYSDSRTQQVYNYYHNRQFYDEISNRHLTDTQIQNILKDHAASAAFANTLDRKTTTNLKALHLIP